MTPIINDCTLCGKYVEIERAEKANQIPHMIQFFAQQENLIHQ